MAKITLSGNFNFDYDNIDDLLAADIIKMVIERQYGKKIGLDDGPKTEYQSCSRKRHIQAVDSREEQPAQNDSGLPKEAKHSGPEPGESLLEYHRRRTAALK